MVFYYDNGMILLYRLRQRIGRKTHQRISWDYWFKKVLYYQVALVYMLTRLVTNVSQVSTLFIKKCICHIVIVLKCYKLM